MFVFLCLRVHVCIVESVIGDRGACVWCLFMCVCVSVSVYVWLSLHS